MSDDEATRQAHAAGYRPVALDALNFFLADVRGALGPYVNVFLVTEQHWTQESMGWVTTISGLLGLLAQTPIGAAIDSTRRKRALLVASLLVLAAGAVMIYALPQFWPVMVASTAISVVGDVFGPAVAALTVGLVARRVLAARLGRNSAFDHAGNVAIAAAAGLIGWWVSQRAVFLLVPACAALAIPAILAIPARAIDHERARGGDRDGNKPAGPEGLGVLFTDRALLIFAGCALLFHFANAPLLPLVGQKLAANHRGVATAMMSACIIAAQAIMLPIALLVGRYADRVGRKPILLIAFAVLPVRCVLFTLSDNTWWLIGVQVLDGVGAGIFGAITPLLIADLMRGTGRYNLAQGAVATAQGVGASVSGVVSGVIVDHMGYTAAFLEGAVMAGVALAALWIALPETAPQAARPE